MDATSAALAVLLVEPVGRAGQAPVLRRNGFHVTAVPSAEAALYEYGRAEFDCVVASMSLPGMGVIGLCSELRRRGRVPVLIVGTDETTAWLAALDAGADDHVDVPCDDRELTARLRALARRSRGALAPTRVLRIGDLDVRVRGDRVEVGPECLLTALQATVLHHLAMRAGAVVDVAALRRRVAVDHGTGAVDRLDVELEHLRVALALASGAGDVLQHVPDGGWRLNPTGTRDGIVTADGV